MESDTCTIFTLLFVGLATSYFLFVDLLHLASIRLLFGFLGRFVTSFLFTVTRLLRTDPE
jgi:hypothetical protein